MKLILTTQPVDKISADLLVLMHYENDVPFKGMSSLIDWRFNGKISRFIQSQKFDGRAKELLLVPAEGRFKAREVIFLGMGRKDDFNEAHIPQVLDYLLEVVTKKKNAQVCFSLNQLLAFPFEWRNVVRLLGSKIAAQRTIKEVILCETEECVREAKKRRLELGPGVQVGFE